MLFFRIATRRGDHRKKSLMFNVNHSCYKSIKARNTIAKGLVKTLIDRPVRSGIFVGALKIDS